MLFDERIPPKIKHNIRQHCETDSYCGLWDNTVTACTANSAQPAVNRLAELDSGCASSATLSPDSRAWVTCRWGLLPYRKCLSITLDQHSSCTEYILWIYIHPLSDCLFKCPLFSPLWVSGVMSIMNKCMTIYALFLICWEMPLWGHCRSISSLPRYLQDNLQAGLGVFCYIWTC